MKKFIQRIKDFFHREKIVIHYHFDETPDKQYEFHTIKPAGQLDHPETVNLINELGLEGWDIVNIDYIFHELTVTFKRVKP